jgi:hypothetical protein
VCPEPEAHGAFPEFGMTQRTFPRSHEARAIVGAVTPFGWSSVFENND